MNKDTVSGIVIIQMPFYIDFPKKCTLICLLTDADSFFSTFLFSMIAKKKSNTSLIKTKLKRNLDNYTTRFALEKNELYILTSKPLLSIWGVWLKWRILLIS